MEREDLMPNNKMTNLKLRIVTIWMIYLLSLEEVVKVLKDLVEAVRVDLVEQDALVALEVEHTMVVAETRIGLQHWNVNLTISNSKGTKRDVNVSANVSANENANENENKENENENENENRNKNEKGAKKKSEMKRKKMISHEGLEFNVTECRV
jgi:hypothetical protein